MLNHRSLLLGLAALVGLLISASQVSAYQVEPAPWSTLVARSELAVHGHVAASWGDWAPDGSGRVVTRYEVLVWNQRQVKGPSEGRHVIVTLPGGTVGNRRTVVPGLSPLELGDELLLLLTDTPWGWQPMGYEMGILRLNDWAGPRALERAERLEQTLAPEGAAP